MNGIKGWIKHEVEWAGGKKLLPDPGVADWMSSLFGQGQ